MNNDAPGAMGIRSHFKHFQAKNQAPGSEILGAWLFKLVFTVCCEARW